MTIQSGSPAADVQQSSRSIDAPEFLNRLAEDLRARSGSDLPLSCYVEQVKLQLAGGKSPEELQGEVRESANSNTPYQSSDFYRSWALPE